MSNQWTEEKLKLDILEAGYKIQPDEIVCGDDCKKPKNDFYYFAECACCDDTSVYWYKRLGCTECIDGSLNSIFCGGHYEELLRFHNNILYEESKSQFGWNIVPAKERMSCIIMDRLEDMDIDQLITTINYLKT